MVCKAQKKEVHEAFFCPFFNVHAVDGSDSGHEGLYRLPFNAQHWVILKDRFPTCCRGPSRASQTLSLRITQRHVLAAAEGTMSTDTPVRNGHVKEVGSRKPRVLPPALYAYHAGFKVLKSPNQCWKWAFVDTQARHFSGHQLTQGAVS